jgi:hypothetical protein
MEAPMRLSESLLKAEELTAKGFQGDTMACHVKSSIMGDCAMAVSPTTKSPAESPASSPKSSPRVGSSLESVSGSFTRATTSDLTAPQNLWQRGVSWPTPPTTFEGRLVERNTFLTFYDETDEDIITSITEETRPLRRVNSCPGGFASPTMDLTRINEVSISLSQLAKLAPCEAQVDDSKINEVDNSCNTAVLEQSQLAPVCQDEENWSDFAPTAFRFEDLPDSLTQDDLINLLEDEGFNGLYDFIYLPDPSTYLRKTGHHAIINFSSHAFGLLFSEQFDGRSLGEGHQSKVHWSSGPQGITALVEHYRKEGAMHQSIPFHQQPAVFWSGLRVQIPDVQAPTPATSKRTKAAARQGAASQKKEKITSTPAAATTTTTTTPVATTSAASYTVSGGQAEAQEWMQYDSYEHFPHQVQILGLPRPMLSEAMLEVMLEQASLEPFVLGLNVNPGPGVASVTLSTRSAAMWCLKHFNGCIWRNSDSKAVSATLVDSMTHDMEDYATGATTSTREDKGTIPATGAAADGTSTDANSLTSRTSSKSSLSSWPSLSSPKKTAGSKSQRGSQQGQDGSPRRRPMGLADASASGSQPMEERKSFEMSSTSTLSSPTRSPLKGKRWADIEEDEDLLLSATQAYLKQ